MASGTTRGANIQRWLGGVAAIAIAASAGIAGCGGDSSTATGGTAGAGGSPTTSGTGGTGGSPSTGGGPGSSSSSHSSSGTGGSGGSTTGSGGSGGTGGGPVACTTPAGGPTRGSAIASTPDDNTLLVVNRDPGTVTVMSVDYGDGQPTMTPKPEVAVGAEPWQVAVDGCGTTAYVVSRKDQKLVELTNITGTPTVGRTVATGSEPTAVALSPDNTKIYVANWVDGTVGIYDAAAMTLTKSVDLNVTLVATGLLGPGLTARAAMAHPRAIAVDANGDVYVTEWSAQRTAAELAPSASNADENWKGLLYKMNADGTSPTAIDLPPIHDTLFADHTGAVTGCFPNQVASVTIFNGNAYVTSTCASPRGPIGVFVKGTCANDAGCGGAVGSCVGATPTGGAGSCKGSCTQNSDCGLNGGVCDTTNGACKPDTVDVKTTTHPAVTVVNLTSHAAVTTNLDQKYIALPDRGTPPNFAPRRMPLLPTDIAFFGGQFGYVTSEGADAVFRFNIDGNGAITTVGSAQNDFIDMRRPAQTPPDTTIRLPIGIAMSHSTQAFAFVANDGSRDVDALALQQQAIAGNGTTDFRITQSSALPLDAPGISALNGKRFFNTGLARWSLAGQAWGSCGACHIDGLTDNVTWYFARGPRQTVSLDGTFAKGLPPGQVDQRILNWTAIFDEVADFEGNTRGISGGVGALVSANSVPPANADRINTGAEAPPQQGLQGSSAEIANPAGTAPHPHSVRGDWIDIEAWVKTVRSPRRPTNLVAADVSDGKALFSATGQGNCAGCHGGKKWTISTRFYTPDDTANCATNGAGATCLGNIDWSTGLNGFPSPLFPSTVAGQQRMRFGAAPAAEQIQCILRPVGTIKAGGTPGSVAGVSSTDIGVLELRQDMVTPGQGLADNGRGFNPPSLLNLQVGAPFFHAGNARTLEEVFDLQDNALPVNQQLFSGHYQSAVASVFVLDPDKIRKLTAYLLSIDESETSFAIPALGNTGGDFCRRP